MGYKDTAFLIVLQILSAQTGASRMALMMGGAKFLGVEKKHLIKFTFLSLIPVLIMELAFNLEDISTLYYIVTGNLNIFIIVLVSSFILVATAKRVFAMQEFYKFYYYLAGLGIWTILDILFGKR
jgi:undecaprenyl pyrophosphate phosphatase UppP